jgi:hypothetical protein
MRAWVREAGQNSLDAGATRIDCTLSPEAIAWRDNGCGMSRKVLVEKFFALGASGKEFEDTVGGFGIAKTLLCFAHKSYTIRTRGWIVEGRKGEFNMRARGTDVKGTELSVQFEDGGPKLEHVKGWVSATTPAREVEMIVNGSKLEWYSQDYLNKLKTFDFGEVWEGSGHEGKMFIRLHGQLMFEIQAHSKSLVVELNDVKYLQSNRDNMLWNEQNKLEKFAKMLMLNPNELYERDYPDVYYTTGKPLIGRTESSTTGTPMGHKWAITAVGEYKLECLGDADECVSIYNYTSKILTIEEASELLQQYKVLLDRWREAVVWASEGRVTLVGLVVSTVLRAVCVNRCVLAINPIEAGVSVNVLRALALHETAHMEHSYHDADFANKLTGMMEKYQLGDKE